jgi:CubicO group peptidase (beta-lactamase class C family)/signal transduction histidine kinase
MNTLAAAVAFFALGVTFMGTALLLLFNPRASSVRWFSVFQLSLMVWLAAQGWAYATDGWDRLGPVVSGAVHMAPGLFLAFSIHENRESNLGAAAAILLALLLLPLDLASVNARESELVLLAWTVGAWSVATVLFVRKMKRESGSPREKRIGRTVLILMTMVMPVGVLGGILTRGETSVFIMPLAMVWIQGLLFYGVARLRFYDIEIRAVRTGELAAAAAEQERLAIVGELSASLAHEIRNPLTGVRSLAQRLAEEEIPEDKRRRYASVILEEVGRVERLVANLLGIAKRAPRVRDADARTPLAPLFDDLALLVTGRAEKASIRVSVDAHGATAHSAREPLAQALLNLLLNAVEHTPAGGTVSLAARTAESGTTITVRDGGPGVPREQRERIWEPFHTGGGGTGLGLAVVRRVAREEAWTVDVDDAPGGGAEFRIVIPTPIPVDATPLRERARVAGGAALMLFALAAPAHAQTAVPPSNALAAERAHALWQSAGVPGLAVAVATGGQVSWSAGYGWANVEDSIRATPSTVFGIGSVSKPLTAAALMRLVERGTMELDAPAQRYAALFPDKGAPVTIRQLAGHLGGIRHYEPRDFGRTTRPRTATEALAIFAYDPLVAPPGTRHAYSSYGYVLLSAAMESAAGRGFLTLMQDEVFAPLRMERTGVDLLKDFDPTRAVQYAGCPAACAPSPYVEYAGTWAGGGFTSTAIDLARFGGLLLEGSFLRRETLEVMWTPQRTAAGEDTGYGIGWRVGRDAAGRRMVYHGGRTHQLRAFLLLYPDHGVAIAVLANGPADFAEAEVERVAEPFLPRHGS